MIHWDPDSYLKFKDERLQPAYDLVARLDLTPARIVDIGCGPGTSTRVLAERWPQARLTGLDSSPEMIARACQGDLVAEWLLADAATWQPDEPFDLVFSNATLQWIPNHAALIPHLFDLVRQEGALAVQIPANYDSPIFQAIERVSQRTPWRQAMVDCGTLITYHSPEFYYDLLVSLSPRVQLWQSIYYHVLDSHQGLVDWYASTGMRPYLERLESAAEKVAFQQEVLADCRPSYPLQADGKVLFPFQRTFFIAHKEVRKGGTDMRIAN